MRPLTNREIAIVSGGSSIDDTPAQAIDGDAIGNLPMISIDVLTTHTQVPARLGPAVPRHAALNGLA